MKRGRPKSRQYPCVYICHNDRYRAMFECRIQLERGKFKTIGYKESELDARILGESLIIEGNPCETEKAIVRYRNERGSIKSQQRRLGSKMRKAIGELIEFVQDSDPKAIQSISVSVETDKRYETKVNL